MPENNKPATVKLTECFARTIAARLEEERKFSLKATVNDEDLGLVKFFYASAGDKEVSVKTDGKEAVPLTRFLDENRDLFKAR